MKVDFVSLHDMIFREKKFSHMSVMRINIHFDEPNLEQFFVEGTKNFFFSAEVFSQNKFSFT